MRLFISFVLLFCLSGCYAVEDATAPAAPSGDVIGRPVAVAPTAPGPSNPAVVTTRGVLAYHRDLEACRAKAGRTVGAGDDVAALQRAIDGRPLRGSVSVSYRSDDVAMARDAIVKECLSQRGYLVRR